jgi:hypothetical protein
MLAPTRLAGSASQNQAGSSGVSWAIQLEGAIIAHRRGQELALAHASQDKQITVAQQLRDNSFGQNGYSLVCEA